MKVGSKEFRELLPRRPFASLYYKHCLTRTRRLEQTVPPALERATQPYKMNIFRILGAHAKKWLLDPNASLTNSSGSFASGLYLHTARQNAIIQCKRQILRPKTFTTYNNLTQLYAERIRHLLQIAIRLPHCLRDTLPRSLLDRPVKVVLEHILQDRLHLLAVLHHLPHAQRLQAYTRSKPRYVQSGIPDRRSSGDGLIVSVPIRSFRGVS